MTIRMILFMIVPFALFGAAGEGEKRDSSSSALTSSGALGLPDFSDVPLGLGSSSVPDLLTGPTATAVATVPVDAPTISMHSFMLTKVVNHAHHCVTLTSPSGEQFIIPKGQTKAIDRVVAIQPVVDLSKMALENIFKQFWTMHKGKHSHCIIHDIYGVGMVRVKDEGGLDERKPIAPSSDKFLRQALVLNHATAVDRKKPFELVLDTQLAKRLSRSGTSRD